MQQPACPTPALSGNCVFFFLTLYVDFCFLHYAAMIGEGGERPSGPVSLFGGDVSNWHVSVGTKGEKRKKRLLQVSPVARKRMLQLWKPPCTQRLLPWQIGLSDLAARQKKVMPQNRGCLGDLISETSVLLCWEDMGPVQLVNICGCIMCNKFCSYNFSLARWPPFSPPFQPGEFNSAFVYKACLCSEAMYSFCFEAQNRFACRWSAWSNSSLKFYSHGTYEPPL